MGKCSLEWGFSLGLTISAWSKRYGGTFQLEFRDTNGIQDLDACKKHSNID